VLIKIFKIKRKREEEEQKKKSPKMADEDFISSSSDEEIGSEDEGGNEADDNDDADDNNNNENDEYEEEMDEDIAAAIGHDKQLSFEVMAEADVLEESKKLIEGVMEFLGIPNRAIAACLLRSNNWNRQLLIDQYLDNSDKVCEKAGIPSLDLESPIENPTHVSECLVCLDQYKNADSFALPCGHRYCRSCWKEYLEISIQDGPGCISIKCMAPKCRSVVHEDAFKKIVSPESFVIYNRFLLRSFVDDNPKVKWCPAPGCSNCIRCERKNRREAVICKCKFAFCFQCADCEIGDHMPANCTDVEMWKEKAADESENVTWMIANTKKCPECRSPIEKNGGCMHMTCNKNAGGCGHEFCWLCRGAWTEHGSHTGGFYNCNKYDVSNAKSEDMKAADAKTELEHYMFYYHRCEAHKAALKIADTQKKLCEKRSTALMTKFDVRSIDTRFLFDATEQLRANRRVLQWSYVYGFYLSKDKVAEKNLFEYLQEDMEKHTNYLSELYEKPIEKIADYQAFIKWSEEVNHYTHISTKFLQNFVEGVAGGLTTGDDKTK